MNNIMEKAVDTGYRLRLDEDGDHVLEEINAEGRWVALLWIDGADGAVNVLRGAACSLRLAHGTTLRSQSCH